MEEQVMVGGYGDRVWPKCESRWQAIAGTKFCDGGGRSVLRG